MAEPEFPFPLATYLALRLVLEPEELEANHLLRVRLVHDDGEELANFQGGFAVSRRDDEPYEDVAVTVAFPFVGVELPTPGNYEFKIAVDEVELTSVRFRAHEVEDQP